MPLLSIATEMTDVCQNWLIYSPSSQKGRQMTYCKAIADKCITRKDRCLKHCFYVFMSYKDQYVIDYLLLKIKINRKQ